METRPCEETTRPSFGEHAEGFNRNYKSKKNYLIVKKNKSQNRNSPLEGFFQGNVKASIYSKKFWRHKY